MKSCKGQVAMEYLLVIGTVFFAVIFFFYYAYSETNKSIQMNMANDVVSTLAKTADMVYSLGPGSQDYVQIEMPGSVKSIDISQKQISMKIKIFGDFSDVFAVTKYNVTGTISIKSGSHYVSIKALDNDVVQLSE